MAKKPTAKPAPAADAAAAAPATSTAVATTSKNTAIANANTDWSALEGEEQRPENLEQTLAGTEDIGADEIRLPRLSIAQGLSPQMVPSEASYIKGLALFEMFNDVTGQIYGNGPLTVVPVKRTVQRIEFDPDDRKVVLDRDIPAGDPRTQWTVDEDGTRIPPRATEFVEFICLLLVAGAPKPEPIVVSIKTTNKQMRAAAELWTTFIKLRGSAIYHGLYKISTKGEKGKTADGQDTNYGVFVIKNAGFIPTQTPQGHALMEMAKAFHESLENKVIVVNREPGDEDFDTAAMDAQGASDRGM